jgi:hypothetical protein
MQDWTNNCGYPDIGDNAETIVASVIGWARDGLRPQDGIFSCRRVGVITVRPGYRGAMAYRGWGINGINGLQCCGAHLSDDLDRSIPALAEVIRSAVGFPPIGNVREWPSGGAWM